MAIETKVFDTDSQLIDQIVADLTQYISSAVANKKEVHIALTGGRSGTQIAKTIFAHPVIDSRLVHIWWSDERYLPTGDLERNDSTVPTEFAFKTQIHRFSTTDNSTDLADAVNKATTELHLATTTRFCDRNVIMDIALLSVGPDGHIASLFPHHSALNSTAAIIGISDSPKPPLARITWTLPTLNASEQIWLIASDGEKASAVSKLLSGADVTEIPASGVSGKLKTVLYAEKSALA